MADMPKPRGFQIADYKIVNKNTLTSVFTVIAPSGMRLHGVMLHERADARWISLPGKPYNKADGTTEYTTIIDFVNREVRDRFQAAVLQALDSFLERQR
jgi:hypothetical protein